MIWGTLPNPNPDSNLTLIMEVYTLDMSHFNALFSATFHEKVRAEAEAPDYPEDAISSEAEGGASSGASPGRRYRYYLTSPGKLIGDRHDASGALPLLPGPPPVPGDIRIRIRTRI